MGKNNKPMLTVLVDDDKLQQLRSYSRAKSVSMGWVVNRLLDRLLSGELDVMSDPSSIATSVATSVATSGEPIATSVEPIDLENLVATAIQSIDIENLVTTSIDKLGLIAEVAQLRSEMVRLPQLEIETSRITQLELEIAKIAQLSEAIADIKELIADRPASPPTAAKEPNPPTLEILTQLVKPGIKATAIANKLNELDYTNTLGEPITREHVYTLLRAHPDLKAVYDTGKP